MRKKTAKKILDVIEKLREGKDWIRDPKKAWQIHNDFRIMGNGRFSLVSLQELRRYVIKGVRSKSYRSKYENVVSEMLKDLKIPYERQRLLFTNEAGMKIVDFFIPPNIVIEVSSSPVFTREVAVSYTYDGFRIKRSRPDIRTIFILFPSFGEGNYRKVSKRKFWGMLREAYDIVIHGNEARQKLEQILPTSD